MTKTYYRFNTTAPATYFNNKPYIAKADGYWYASSEEELDSLIPNWRVHLDFTSEMMKRYEGIGQL